MGFDVMLTEKNFKKSTLKSRSLFSAFLQAENSINKSIEDLENSK